MDQVKSSLKQKTQIELLKRQQVCTNSILKDFNYQLSLPLEHAHVQQKKNVNFSSKEPGSEADTIRKDVRAPVIEMTFDIQSDVHANSQDPAQQAVVDRSYKINFNKTDLQQFFEQLEQVQIKVDGLTNQ